MKKPFYIILVIVSFIVFCFYFKDHFVSKGEYARMFVSSGRFNIPFIEVEIQGKAYPFKINLGWTRFPLYLSKDLLSQIDKRPNGVAEIVMDGDTIEFQTYLLPKVEIGDLVFNDVSVMEVDPDKEKPKSTEMQVAEIGLKFFENKNLLLDFSNATIIACDNLKKLKQVGYSIEDMTRTAFEVGRKGLILTVETDLGLIKLGVSSENSLSLIRSDIGKEEIAKNSKNGFPNVATSVFVIGGKDFGNKDLYLCDDIPDSFGVDGYIGMDFLQHHVLYFDFRNKVAYIGEDEF